MKVAIFSESSADEAAIRILTEGILERTTELIAPPALRSRGWPSVRQNLPTVLRHLHFRTDAEALALVVDSDDQPPHLAAHDQQEEIKCRLCELRRIAREVQSKLSPRPAGQNLKLAIGMAVPSIEAWFRCGLDPHVTEAAWVNGLREKRDPYTKNSLKTAVYGTDRPGLDWETRHMVEQATRLKSASHLIESLFPNGFGPFARAVRSW